MKYSCQTLLVLILLGLLSHHADASSSYNYLSGENNVIIDTTTSHEVVGTIHLGIITQNSHIYLNIKDEITLQLIYKGNTVSIMLPDPVCGDFFLTIKGTGSGAVTILQNTYSDDRCVGTSCQVDNCIYFTPTPDIDSSLTEGYCRAETIEEKGSYCVVQFDLIPLLETTIFPSTTKTSTTLAGGVFIEGNPPQKNIELSPSNQVDIKVLITADSDHIGQEADIIVVASHTESETWYMLDGEKGVKPWDGKNIDILSAFKKNIRLAETQHIELYHGHLPEGSWEIYFGYRLKSSTIIYNSEPITIQITP